MQSDFSMLRDFDLSEIPADELRERAIKEADGIWGGNLVGNRTYERVVADSAYGNAAELFCIHHGGMEDDKRQFRDVIQNNIPFEVKCTEHVGNIDRVLEKLATRKMRFGNRHADYALIWTNARKQGSTKYEFQGVYYWSKGRFWKQRELA